MKKSLLFALCLTSVNIAMSQWQKVYPLDNAPVNYLKSFSANKAIASYENHILKTENGGEDWVTTTLFYAEDIKLHFLNDTLGYACGIAHFPVGPTLYKTVNGGTTWDTLSLSIGVGITTHGISFVDENLGYVVHGNKIYKTVNGGVSFDTTAFVDNGYNRLNEIYFMNPQIGFMAAQVFDANTMMLQGNCIYMTHDGAASWHQVYTDNLVGAQNFDYNGIKKIHFISALEGWAIGDEGLILYTTNGGNNWTTVANSFDYNIDDIQFFNTNTGYITSGGKLYKTTDAMQSWTEELGVDELPFDFYAVSMLTVDTGYASGHGIFSLHKEHTIGVSALEPEKGLLVVYPNPATTKITLQKIAQNIESAHWVDVTGKIIAAQYNKADQTITIGALAAGNYYLVINTGTQQWRKKVTILK